MNDKNVLFVCQYFYPENISSGILPFELATELSKYGYHVHALVGYPHEYYTGDPVQKHECVNGIMIKRFHYPQFNRARTFGRILNYFSFCFFLLFHINSFKNSEYCFTYTNPPLLPVVIASICKLFRIKMILVIYDLYPDAAINAKMIKETSFIAKLLNKANRYTYKQCWKIIALASECREYLINYKKVNPSKVHVIPNWYKKQSILTATNNQKLTILYGGNMGIMQDMNSVLSLIIELKDVDNITFILAGHGNKKDKIVQELVNLEINNCKVYDFLPKEEYDLLMNQVDLAIVSLEKFAIGLGSPSKAYGYLSKGIPIIAMMSQQTELCKDIIHFECGFVYDGGNIGMLSQKIENILANRNLLDKMKKNAIKLFETKYSLDVISKQYIKILNKS